MCVRESVCVRERECVCERERECVRERERERVCVRACVRVCGAVRCVARVKKDILQNNTRAR